MGGILFVTPLFSSDRARAADMDTVHELLEALVRINVRFLKRNPKTPSIYSWARYEMEPPGVENWRDIPSMMLGIEGPKNAGDCEDLACALAAEYRIKGINAKAIAIPFAHNLFHIVVQLPNGKIEDPSRKLGMKD